MALALRNEQMQVQHSSVIWAEFHADVPYGDPPLLGRLLNHRAQIVGPGRHFAVDPKLHLGADPLGRGRPADRVSLLVQASGPATSGREWPGARLRRLGDEWPCPVRRGGLTGEELNLHLPECRAAALFTALSSTSIPARTEILGRPF